MGHVVYQGAAPTFAATKLADMNRSALLSEIDPVTGLAIDADASMLYRRLKVYKFHALLAKPTGQMKYCATCFAQLILSQAGE